MRDGGRTLWLSGACWSVMFTAFMLALTLTTVANVLVTMALAPLLTALMARFALGNRLPARTWATVARGGLRHRLDVRPGGPGRRPAPARSEASSRSACRSRPPSTGRVIQASRSGADRDLLPAVLIGATLSALLTLPLALPFVGSAHDIGWLALLGVAQLAIPCLMAVAAARALSAPEVSLLALLEIVFGVAWAWLVGGEAPASHVLGGGLLVLGALAANEALAMRRGLVAAGR